MSARTTISDAMRRNGLTSYTRQAEPVIVAVEQREGEIANRLLSFATSRGLSEAEARRALTGAGLSVPPPAPAPTTAAANGDANSAAAALGRIEATMNSLVSFARRHGFNG
jgi:hypothetical protein